MQYSLGFSPVIPVSMDLGKIGPGRGWWCSIGLRVKTYTEISSNSISTPKACRAASASSSPAASIGPGLISEGIKDISAGSHTCENDELASVLVIKAVLALSREYMRGHESDILSWLGSPPLSLGHRTYPKSNRCELVIWANWQWQASLLELWSIGQEVFSVETGSIDIY